MQQNKHVIEEPSSSWIKEMFSLSALKVIALADLFQCKEIDQNFLLDRIKERKIRIVNEGNILFVPASELPGLVGNLADDLDPFWPLFYQLSLVIATATLLMT